MKENRVLMIVGPTCVGKTGAAILAAREMGTGIISADSMQIYRGMDIGTEKPSPAELAAAPHHMIDVADPREPYSAGRYMEMVVPVIEGLHAEGRVPIVVGGTGLYIKAMTRGLFKGPEADRALRERLLSEQPEALYARLVDMDTEAARAIEPNDTRRVLRALEICMLGGARASELRADLTRPLPYEFVKTALVRDREELYAMIEARVDGMIARGLVEEVGRVLASGPDRTAMQAIGYKEMAGHINGAYDLDEAVRLIKRNTRRYAKRQLTWFRREEALTWVDISGTSSAVDAYERLRPVLFQSGLL